MNGHYIAGVFESASDAQSAINAIAQAGISRADIGLYPQADVPLNSDITTANATEHSSARLIQLFRSVMGMDDEGDRYGRLFSRSIERGCSVVTIRIENDAELDAAVEAMQQFNPVDVQELEDTPTGPQPVNVDKVGGVHVFRRRSGG